VAVQTRAAQSTAGALANWRERTRTTPAELPNVNLPGRAALEAALSGVRKSREREGQTWTALLPEWKTSLPALRPKE
jgi:hypothetical protein